MPGLLATTNASRASASADLRGLFDDKAERENCDARVNGRAQQVRVQRGGDVSDQLGLVSESGEFRGTQCSES